MITLLPATVLRLRAALAGRESLAAAIGAIVPDSWPPEYLDEAAFRYTIDWLETPGREVRWGMRFVLLRDKDRPLTLIGSCGFKDQPDARGEIELGYGICAAYRRRGFATQVTRMLIEEAFADARVRAVIAETMPELIGSIGVLMKCGFELVGEGSEPGVIRYRLERS